MGVFYSVHRWDLPNLISWTIISMEIAFLVSQGKGSGTFQVDGLTWFPTKAVHGEMYDVCTLYVRCMYGWISSPTSTKEESSLQNVWKSIIQGVSAWRREIEVGIEEQNRTEKKKKSKQSKANTPPAAGWTIHTETRTTTTFRQTRQEKSLFKG